MKLKVIPAALFMFILASTAMLMSGEGRYTGKIGTIDTEKKEIIVNVEGGTTITMGEQLYIRVSGEIIIMEATFPMQTQVKCRLLKAGAKYFKIIEKGMNVYKYDRTAIEEKKIGAKKSSYITGHVEKIGNTQMVYIEGGTFIMGSPVNEKDRHSEEKQHKVTVSSFWMGKYEVIQREYEDVMGTTPSYFKGGNLPVEMVNWYDAVEFCNKLSEKNGLKPYYYIDKDRKDQNNKASYDDIKWTVTVAGGNGFRLPTEAEWEYACRSGTMTAFCYGNSLDSSMANFNGNYPYNASKGAYREKTTAVGTFKPNSYGLYDMHGNVYEWCWDWYGIYGDTVNDPEGVDSAEYHVLRGGSWNNDGADLRSANRGDFSSYGRSVIHSRGGAKVRKNYIGFRVVRSTN